MLIQEFTWFKGRGVDLNSKVKEGMYYLFSKLHFDQ